MERRTAVEELSRRQIEDALQQAGHAAQVLAHELMPHGRANTGYLVTTTQGRLVLRLHVRDAACCAKERAIHELVDDSVPVPALLASCESSEAVGCPFSLLAFVPGVTLERALQGGAEQRLETAARSLGHALARCTQFRFETFGDLQASPNGGALRVEPWSFADFYQLVLFETPAAARLGDLRDRVWRLVQSASERFPDSWPPHLVHGDFNPTNLLVADHGELNAVLDWEFANAGKLWMDLGNLLRHRPGSPLPPYFVPALLEGLTDLGVAIPETWNELRLLSDLSNACELLSSAEDRPETHQAALKQIRQTLKALE